MQAPDENLRSGVVAVDVPEIELLQGIVASGQNKKERNNDCVNFLKFQHMIIDGSNNLQIISTKVAGQKFTSRVTLLEVTSRTSTVNRLLKAAFQDISDDTVVIKYVSSCAAP
jgi:uncharacterized membrane protein